VVDALGVEGVAVRRYEPHARCRIRHSHGIIGAPAVDVTISVGSYSMCGG
jgi:hypothetical protein